MIHLCKKNDLLPPEFQEYSGGFSVTFHFKESIGTSAPVGLADLTPRQMMIVSLLREKGPLTFRNINSDLKEPILICYDKFYSGI